MSGKHCRLGSDKPCPLLDVLSDGVLAHIFSLLPTKDKQVAEGVCKRWQGLMRDSSYPVYGTVLFDVSKLATNNYAVVDWVGRRCQSMRAAILSGQASELSADCMSASEGYLQQWLGFFSGHLAAAGTTAPQVHLEFTGQRSILRLSCFQQASFLQLLSPVVTVIKLQRLRQRLSPEEVAALGQLAQLQELSICTAAYGETEEAGVYGPLDVTGVLTGLRTLKLEQHSQLTTLPACIARLQQLDIAACTRLTGLPLSLWTASKLQSLQLSGCGITDATFSNIPGSLSALRQLTRIFMSKATLSQLPPAFTQLPALRKLHMFSSTVTNPEWLPVSYSCLTSLDCLALTYCSLQSLPETICTLGGLTALDVSGNMLSSLPGAMSNMQGLQRLDLTNNKFLHLPDMLSTLSSLTEFDLVDQEPRLLITKPMEFLFVLPQLTQVALYGCDESDHTTCYYIGQAMARLARLRATGHDPASRLLWRVDSDEYDSDNDGSDDD